MEPEITLAQRLALQDSEYINEGILQLCNHYMITVNKHNTANTNERKRTDSQS